MSFYAHSGHHTDKSDWQPLDDHLTQVGALAGRFASRFGAETLGQAAGLLHDLGKYTDEFQRRISGDYGRVDHSTWGARVAVERYGQLGKLLAYGIAGHHAGLANGRDAGERTTLSDRLKAELPTLKAAWEAEISIPCRSELTPPRNFRAAKERGQFQLAFLARMIFSSLVDADFLDTEAFYDSLDGRLSRRPVEPPSLQELRAELDTHLGGFKPDTDVNRIRADILAGVRAKAIEPPGLFSLTVPTGGGKTLASLAFALDHAIAHGLRRVIYVIPFTSIVEQNAAVFRCALGPLGERAVLEHHSAFIAEQPSKVTPDQYQALQKLRLAMENWDAPIVVTTAVQFFESLFADRPSRCRKLHNIAGSVVILDEAQTLPLKLLRPCVAAIDELALNYSASVVLCTATQPALKASDEFRGGFHDVRELAPDPQQLYIGLKRVNVRHVGSMNDAELTQHLVACEQVLCIVNNRRHARVLYQAIAEQPGARHLTTLMCAKHRSQELAAIRVRLNRGEPCRLVATSLIEAGVDIDFPTVLRAEAGLDSIAQAAGRCNREGRRPVAESNVLVFTVDNSEWAPPPELRQFAQAARSVLRQSPDDPLSLVTINRYFRELYWQKGSQELDAHNLLGLVEAGKIDGFPFETLAAKFRMIEEAQRPVIIAYDAEARAIIGELEFAESCGALARRLQPYVVLVPPNAYEALRAARAIQPIGPQKFGEQFVQLVNPDLYDHHFGLRWDYPEFISAERLTW
jgi:CRISPR-associated endonuclease/helicase Cas3